MKCAAVTVERRLIGSFPQTVRDHMKHLPGFDLVIFGSDENKELFKNNLQDFVFHRTDYKDRDGYTKLLTSPKFWELLAHYDRVLIFQADSMLLRTGIEEFLEWDYVGAPWTFQKHGGNGGLSLRNPSVMLSICRQNQWRSGGEDIFFCNLMKNKYKLAPREVCEKFSVESIFKLGTLGYHQIDPWLTKEQCDLIRNQYKKIVVPNAESTKKSNQLSYMYKLVKPVKIVTRGVVITQEALKRNPSLANIIMDDARLRAAYGHNFEQVGGHEKTITVTAKKKAEALKESPGMKTLIATDFLRNLESTASVEPVSTSTEVPTGGQSLNVNEVKPESKSEDTKHMNRKQRREKLKEQKSGVSEVTKA